MVGSQDFTDKITEDGLGYSTEWNGGVIVKLGLSLVPITPRAFFLYHTLNGSEDFVDPLGIGTSINSNSQSILSVGLGAQIGFTPVPAGFDPYFAIDLMYNSFGELKQTTFGVDSKFYSISRFGLGLGVGAEILLIPVLNLDVLISYQMMNLVGKEDGESSLSILTVDAFLLFSFL